MFKVLVVSFFISFSASAFVPDIIISYEEMNSENNNSNKIELFKDGNAFLYNKKTIKRHHGWGDEKLYLDYKCSEIKFDKNKINKFFDSLNIYKLDRKYFKKDKNEVKHTIKIKTNTGIRTIYVRDEYNKYNSFFSIIKRWFWNDESEEAKIFEIIEYISDLDFEYTSKCLSTSY